MASPVKESDIRRQIRDYLRLKGWFTFHLLQGLGSYPGLSDLVALKAGQVLFIELKRPGGRQSEKQKEFQHNVEAQGCRYILARGIEDLQKEGI